LIVFGKRAGEFAATYAKANRQGTVDGRQVDDIAKWALEPFERGAAAEGPYQVQYALQDMMQELVGIVRTEAEMQKALDGLRELKARAVKVGVGGHREYNPGWHSSLDLFNLLAISEAVARSALERRESRGGHFREDYPNKDAKAGTFNLVVRKGRDGEMELVQAPISEMPQELKDIIEANK